MENRLENLLVDDGLVSVEQMERARSLARQKNKPLLRAILEEHMADEEAVLLAVAKRQGVRFICLKEIPVLDATIKTVSARFVSHYLIMPVSLDSGVLTIAVSDPFDMSAMEDIQASLGLRVERAFACRSDIAEAIRKYYGIGAETVERILDEMPSAHEPEVKRRYHDLEKTAEDASVVRLVNQILDQAIRDRATDVHFEAYEDGVVIRRRIDGLLHDTKVAENISVLYPPIISRIKLMADLNIVERRLPQDGRVSVKMGQKEYDLRVSVIPTLHGENIVVRILPATMLLSMEDLGLSPRNHETLTGLISRPHGIIMVTGPTGSGKSTTLYACLSKLNTRERKIITIEDPVEYEIKGLTQTQINPQIGLTFARALRSMLRHDPNVMMVGEIRDRETAEVTVQTALTGHLVFSTLHTNDAASAAVRLVDMGVDPYLVASSVRAFTAQRLVRVICAGCREQYEAGGKIMFRGKGCRKCSNTGYYGRVAICEILVLDDIIGELVMRRASASEIKTRAVSSGMVTMLQDGWEKVAQGVTTAEEILRVTSE
ncbi:MAG: ATPase, T2SS/T4P/T4SS family [bacterium]